MSLPQWLVISAAITTTSRRSTWLYLVSNCNHGRLGAQQHSPGGSCRGPTVSHPTHSTLDALSPSTSCQQSASDIATRTNNTYSPNSTHSCQGWLCSALTSPCHPQTHTAIDPAMQIVESVANSPQSTSLAISLPRKHRVTADTQTSRHGLPSLSAFVCVRPPGVVNVSIYQIKLEQLCCTRDPQ